MFSALVNGTSLGFFHSIDGLRQSDPLLFYLFMIVMGTLSNLINRAMSKGFLSSCKVRGRGGYGVQIIHLLFVDDTLVFCEASLDHMFFLSWLLMWLEAILRLKINLDKSEILLVGRIENIEDLTLEHGCNVGVLPSSYLGLSLGVAHESMAVWDGVEERFRKRLVMWKRQFISKWRNHSHPEHFVKYAHIFHVFDAYAKSF